MSAEIHVLDLLPAYVLGSLEADEARQVEQHLLSCLTCRAESNALQDVAEHLSLLSPIAVPPPDLKNRLMQGVRDMRLRENVPAQVSKRSWMERLLPIWGLTSLGLIIALIIFNLVLWQKLNHLEAITSPGGMFAIPLRGTNFAPSATGFVLIGVDGMNGALVVDRLPPLAAGQQYQLWLIRDGQSTSGAIFSTDDESYGGTRIKVTESLFEYSAVNITIEPSGGSLQPTGTKVLDGQFLIPQHPITPPE